VTLILAPETLAPATIGASDVPAILGLSPWQRPAQAWARLSGLAPPSEGNDATRRGQLLERAILWEYADTLSVPYEHRWRGLDVLRDASSVVAQGPPYGGDRFVHPDPSLRWMAARPDALVWLRGACDHIVEVKTCRSWADWQSADGKPIVPPAYFVQVQWQLDVLGLRRCRLEAFNVFDDSRRSIEIEADPKIQAQIRAYVEAWRARHLLGDEYPPDMTAEVAGLVWPAPREPEEWLPATDEHRVLWAEYAAASEAEKAARARKDAARDALVRDIQDFAGIEGLCSWRKGKRGRTFRLLGREEE
jgi:hypothetical protein